MKAVVYKSTGSWYKVKSEEQPAKFYQARLKGIFKIDGIMSTNPIAVGDTVDIEMEPDDAAGNAMITGISKRKNYVNRQSPKNQHQHHIIASNLDQSLLVATLKDPKTSQGFIDRFLIGCESYHVPAIIAFNKCDIYKKKELEKFGQLKEIYEAAGYRVLLMSVAAGEGLAEIKGSLKDRITLVSGHSGVGKSSFINQLLPEMRELRTQEVSGWSGKGMHTTTFAEMMDLPGGGAVIDTPGIREFGLVDISKEELSHYFPEMRSILKDCQFNNCIHINEPGCAVKAAVAAKKIAEERYLSYCNILESINDKSY